MHYITSESGNSITIIEDMVRVNWRVVSAFWETEDRPNVQGVWQTSSCLDPTLEG